MRERSAIFFFKLGKDSTCSLGIVHAPAHTLQNNSLQRLLCHSHPPSTRTSTTQKRVKALRKLPSSQHTPRSENIPRPVMTLVRTRYAGRRHSTPTRLTSLCSLLPIQELLQLDLPAPGFRGADRRCRYGYYR